MLLNGAQFIFRQQLATHLIHPDLGSYRLCRMSVVTRQHEGLYTECAQFLQSSPTAWFYSIRHGKQAVHASIIGQHDHTLALLLKHFQACLKGIGTETGFVNHAVIAQHIALATNTAKHTSPRQSLKPLNLLQENRIPRSSLSQCPRHWMIGARRQTCRKAPYLCRIETGERCKIGLCRLAVRQRPGFV